MPSQFVATLTADADALAGVDWASRTVAEQMDALEGLERLARKVNVLSANLAMTVALQGEAVLGGKPKDVIANRVRVTAEVVKKRLDTAALMAQRTAITGAPLPPWLEHVAPGWRAGVIDDAHVAVITKFLHDLPADVGFVERQEAEALLAGKAVTMRPDELRQVAERIALTLNPDGEFSDADRQRQRGIIFGRQQADGLSSVSGKVTPECRAVWDAANSKLAAPGMCNPDDEDPQVDGEPTEDAVRRDYRTTAQRTHDAFLAAGRAVLASGELGSHHGLPVTVVVTATLDQLETAAGVPAPEPPAPQARPDVPAPAGPAPATGVPAPAGPAPAAGVPAPEAAPAPEARPDVPAPAAPAPAPAATATTADVPAPEATPAPAPATTTTAGASASGGFAVTSSGVLLPMRDVIRMAAHAYHYLCIFDRHSQIPLYLGRTRRLASAGQRIVLHATDRGCSFPRCTMPAYLCEVMHVQDWRHDGPTDITSETLGCKTHHRLHTSGGWQVRKRADGRTEWIPPPQLPLPNAGGVNTYHHPERLLDHRDEQEPHDEE